MSEIRRRMTGSRAYAWAVLGVASLLSGYLILSGSPGEGVGLLISMTTIGAGLYGNKQYQERRSKEVELSNFNNRGVAPNK